MISVIRCPVAAAITRKALVVLVVVSCVLLAGLLVASVELFHHAEHWEADTLVKEFTRQSEAAAIIVSAGLAHYSTGS